MNLEIVAEISAEHLGDLNRALRLCDAAKAAGADALKTQFWTHDTMAAHPEQVFETGPWKGMTAGELYRKCETPWPWAPIIRDYCAEIGIAWFSSVFDCGALSMLEMVGCPRYKIASFELTDTTLIGDAASTRKPIIMSTGMASYDEVVSALYAANAAEDITLLHCVSAYPAPIEDMNLAMIDKIRRDWYCNVGLSDHSTHPLVPVVATAIGATMLEKHLTLSRADNGPDSAFALEPHEFKQMVDSIRVAEQILGEAKYGPKKSEAYLHLRRGPNGRG